MSLRRGVLLCGTLAAGVGILVVLAMPISAFARGFLMLLWLSETLRELVNYRQGIARLHELHLDAGGRVTVIAPDGEVERATLIAGSTVLKNLAWLRVRFPDGSRHGELFRGGPGRDADWHRLQLIWRQRHGAFGRHDGS